MVISCFRTPEVAPTIPERTVSCSEATQPTMKPLSGMRQNPQDRLKVVAFAGRPRDKQPHAARVELGAEFERWSMPSAGGIASKRLLGASARGAPREARWTIGTGSFGLRARARSRLARAWSRSPRVSEAQPRLKWAGASPDRRRRPPRRPRRPRRCGPGGPGRDQAHSGSAHRAATAPAHA